MDKAILKEGCSVYPVLVPVNHQLKSFNFYLVEEKGALTLIDAGLNNRNCWEAFENTLLENGFTMDNLSQIILTHNHEDHVGLVNRIIESKEVPVYAPQESIYRLKRDKQFFLLRIEFFKQLYQQMDCGPLGENQVQKLIKGLENHQDSKLKGEIFPLIEGDRIAGMEVIETPGHSPDHIVLFDKKREWLFCGDHLLSHISSNALVEPDQDGKRIKTLIQYEESLKKCLHLDAKILFPGHGELISDHYSLINKKLTRIHSKSERILKVIEDGNVTGSSIAQTIYKHKYKSEFSLVMSEIVGHLDYLEAHHRIEKKLNNGVWHYHTVSI